MVPEKIYSRNHDTRIQNLINRRMRLVRHKDIMLTRNAKKKKIHLHNRTPCLREVEPYGWAASEKAEMASMGSRKKTLMRGELPAVKRYLGYICLGKNLAPAFLLDVSSDNLTRTGDRNILTKK